MPENWKKLKHDDKDVVEGFCGACLAIPIAFVGIGASAYGCSSRGKYKKTKAIALWSGIVVTVISIIIALYYYFSCSNCR